MTPEPVQVAEESFVIPGALPVPGIGRLPVHAMVIRGEQPMIVDTLAIVQREEFLERVFSLVDPEEVRWLFISHEDRDHTGSVMQVLERCPNARLVTNFLGLGKLGEEFTIDPRRAYFLNDGDSLDIGDRTVTAVRPPLYDSSATRGVWDPKTGVYFAADCFGAVVREDYEWADDLSAGDYEEGFFWMNRANHVWSKDIAQGALDRDAARIQGLDPEVIVSGHGPSVRDDPARVVNWIRRIGDMEPVSFPSQEEFEEMLNENEPLDPAGGRPGLSDT